jgi:hypothetical protein
MLGQLHPQYLLGEGRAGMVLKENVGCHRIEGQVKVSGYWVQEQGVSATPEFNVQPAYIA